MVEFEVVACTYQVQVVHRFHTRHAHVRHLLLLSLVIVVDDLVERVTLRLVYCHSDGDKAGKGETVTLDRLVALLVVERKGCAHQRYPVGL
jgi:hypothetical protein